MSARSFAGRAAQAWRTCAGRVGAVLVAMWVSAPAVAASLVMTNADLALGFDRDTGAWISWVDLRTGDSLIREGGPLVGPAPARAPVLDTEAIRLACASGRALDLAGDGWKFAPVGAGAGADAGSLDGLEWQVTAVPGRRGAGDDRLHDRVGAFWYRRDFVVPAGWTTDDLVIVVGAVDDFDAAWVNGVRIGATGVETPRHWESPRRYRVPAGLVRVGATNWLGLCVTNAAAEGGVAAPVVVGPAAVLPVPAVALPPLTQLQLDSYEGSQMLRLGAEDGTFRYTLDVRLAATNAVFSRQLTIRNVSDAEQLVQTVTMATPALSPGERPMFAFPGSLPVGDQSVAALGEGESVRPRGEDPLVVLWSEGARRGLGSWFYCEEEFSPVSVQRVGDGVRVRHQQQVVARLKPRESMTLGRQYFWLARGGRDPVLSGVQDVYRRVRLSAPTNGMAGLGTQVIYCGHPGGVPERGFRGYGGFKALQAYLPTLERMGVDLLWMLPIWEHGDGQKWNLYSPFDHRQISGLYGTPEELKALSAAASGSRVRLMFDLVPHGPPDFTPLAREHPDWVAKAQDGSPQRAWDQLAFDNGNLGWQRYMYDAAAWGAREFRAVGARVDCAAGGPLNWDRSAGNRPSLSGLAAGLGMTRAIRQGYLDAGGSPVVLPEEYTGAAVYHRVSDLTYDAQFYYLQMELQASGASPETWADRLQQFLHDQQLTQPLGALKMRWISNHDTVSWTFQKARPARVYGTGRMRALWALCAFVEGVPMLYQGDEDPTIWGGVGEASVDYLARIYGLRKSVKGLREGRADYRSVRATGGVFAALRGEGADRELVLISFNPAATTTTLTGVGGAEGGVDRMSGERVSWGAAHSVGMAPHQVRVLAMPGAPDDRR